MRNVCLPTCRSWFSNRLPSLSTLGIVRCECALSVGEQYADNKTTAMISLDEVSQLHHVSLPPMQWQSEERKLTVDFELCVCVRQQFLEEASERRDPLFAIGDIVCVSKPKFVSVRRPNNGCENKYTMYRVSAWATRTLVKLTTRKQCEGVVALQLTEQSIEDLREFILAEKGLDVFDLMRNQSPHGC